MDYPQLRPHSLWWIPARKHCSLYGNRFCFTRLKSQFTGVSRPFRFTQITCGITLKLRQVAWFKSTPIDALQGTQPAMQISLKLTLVQVEDLLDSTFVFIPRTSFLPFRKISNRNCESGWGRKKGRSRRKNFWIAWTDGQTRIHISFLIIINIFLHF